MWKWIDRLLTPSDDPLLPFHKSCLENKTSEDYWTVQCFGPGTWTLRGDLKSLPAKNYRDNATKLLGWKWEIYKDGKLQTNNSRKKRSKTRKR